MLGWICLLHYEVIVVGASVMKEYRHPSLVELHLEVTGIMCYAAYASVHMIVVLGVREKECG